MVVYTEGSAVLLKGFGWFWRVFDDGVGGKRVGAGFDMGSQLSALGSFKRMFISWPTNIIFLSFFPFSFVRFDGMRKSYALGNW